MNNNLFTAKNTWGEGLIMDFAPDNTQATCLTNALNATLLTFNGNEMSLQNDMGNGRVETAFLPEGYVPVGTCEFGDIIYIVSYNPIINKSQIGCFPSPERNISSEEIGNMKQVLKSSDFQVLDKDKDKPTGELIASSVKKVLYGNKHMNPGDKYIIYSDNLENSKNNLSDYGSTKHEHNSDPKLVKIHVVSIEESGKIVYLDSTTKWYDNDYYISPGIKAGSDSIDIDSYRTMLSSAYSVFSSKVSGKLALLIELEKITGFSCSWGVGSTRNYTDEPIKPTEPTEDEYRDQYGDVNTQEYKSAINDYNSAFEVYKKSLEKYKKKGEILNYNDYNINWYINWTTSNDKINPKYIVLTESEWSGPNSDLSGKYRLWTYNHQNNTINLYNEENTYKSLENIPEKFNREKNYYYNIISENITTDIISEIKEKLEQDPYKLNFYEKNNKYENGDLYLINCTKIQYDDEGTPKYYTTDKEGNEKELTSENLGIVNITDNIVNNYFNYPITKEFATFKIPVRQDFTILDNEETNSIIISKEPDISNLVYHYKIAPAMPYGILQEFEQEGYIDFSKIGKKDINLNKWKYFNYENTLTLTWGMNSYVEPNKGISEIVFEFYDNQGFTAAYHVKGKQSYNGTFTEYINLNGSGSNYKFNNIKEDGTEAYHKGLIYELIKNNGYYIIPEGKLYEVSNENGKEIKLANKELIFIPTSSFIELKLSDNSTELPETITSVTKINGFDVSNKITYKYEEDILSITAKSDLYIDSLELFEIEIDGTIYKFKNKLESISNQPGSGDTGGDSSGDSPENGSDSSGNESTPEDTSITLTAGNTYIFENNKNSRIIGLNINEVILNDIKCDTYTISGKQITITVNEDITISDKNNITLSISHLTSGVDGTSTIESFSYSVKYISEETNSVELTTFNLKRNLELPKYYCYDNDSGVIYSNCLYYVKIIVKYNDINALGEFSQNYTKIEDYRWLWTNGMFNDYFYSTDDFKDLQFSLNLDLSSVFDGSKFKMDIHKYQSPDINKEIKKDNLYKSLSAIIQHVNLNPEESSDNFSIKVQGGLENSYNTFNLNKDQLKNINTDIYLGKDNITSNPEEIKTICSGDTQISYNGIIPIISNSDLIIDSTNISTSLYNELTGEELEETEETKDLYDDSQNYQNYKNNFKLKFGTNGPLIETTESINYLSSISKDIIDYKCNKISTTLDKFYNDSNNEINLKLSGIHYSKYAYTTKQYMGSTLRPFALTVEDLNRYNIEVITNNQNKLTAYNSKALMICTADKSGTKSEMQVSIVTLDNTGAILSSSRMNDLQYDSDSLAFNIHDGFNKNFDDIKANFPFLFIMGYGYWDKNQKDEGLESKGDIILKENNGNAYHTPGDLGDKAKLKSNTKGSGAGTIVGYNESSIEPADQHVTGNFHTEFVKYIIAYLTQLFYLSENEQINYWVPDNYIYLEDHYQVYEKDIIVKLEASDPSAESSEYTSHKDLILMSGLNYTNYLKELLTNIGDENEIKLKDPNVDLKLNSCLKTTPLKLQFNYMTPNTNLNNNLTVVLSTFKGPSVLSGQSFDKNSIYVWNDTTKQFNNIRSVNTLKKVSEIKSLNETPSTQELSDIPLSTFAITGSTDTGQPDTGGIGSNNSHSSNGFQDLQDGTSMEIVIDGGGGYTPPNNIINSVNKETLIGVALEDKTFDINKLGINDSFAITNGNILSFKRLPPASGTYKARAHNRSGDDIYLTDYKKDFYYYIDNDKQN